MDTWQNDDELYKGKYLDRSERGVFECDCSQCKCGSQYSFIQLLHLSYVNWSKLSELSCSRISLIPETNKVAKS